MRDAARLDDVGEAAHQLRRLHRRAVRRVRRAEDVGRVEPARAPRRRRAGRGRGRTRRASATSSRARSSCGARACEHDRAADRDVGVDALACRDVDAPRRPCRASRRTARSRRRGRTRAASVAMPTGIQRRAPAAVAPGRAEAGDLGLDARRCAGVGSSSVQVVRRPEPGVAGADDRDVDRRVAVSAGARLDGAGSWSNHSDSVAVVGRRCSPARLRPTTVSRGVDRRA